MTEFKHIGSVISGTYRTADLLPAFADMLETLVNEDQALADTLPQGETRFHAFEEIKQMRDAISYARTVDYESEDASIFLNEAMFDYLASYAPSYFYFGAHPGDGSDFGFWLHEDWQEMARDDDALFVADLADAPEWHKGEVIVVNDHGNATLGYIDHKGEFKTVWSVV